MADTVDKKTRSAIMAKVHSVNTSPEIITRKLLHRLGYRFRLHSPNLPGKPDIVLPKYNTVVFVHGCFWHGCPTCRHAHILPRTNEKYWREKLDKNIKRDKTNIDALQNAGWRVLVIWECETKKRNLDLLTEKLTSFLTV